MAVALVTSDQLNALDAVAARLDTKGLREESQALRDVLAQLRPPVNEVPAAEAAEILYLTTQAVCDRIKGGILPGRRDETGQYFVQREAIEPAIEMRRVFPDTPARVYTDEEIDEEIEAVRAARRARGAASR